MDPISVSALTVLNERIVEYLGVPIVGALKAPKAALRYVALATGIGLGFAFNVDALSALHLTVAAPWVGPLISGVIMGCGSSLLHEFLPGVPQTTKAGG